MTVKRKIVLPLALGVLGLVAVAQIASATHPRPKGATPFRVSLVPAYKQCTAPNRTHGAPLAFPSCAPPVQESNFVTVGTPDANGAGPNSIGSVLLTVGPPSFDGELKVTATISDVRCRPATQAAVCSSANAAGGPDYSGSLESNATIRISDHYNGESLDEAATVQDIPFPIAIHCTSTADTSTGGFCSATSECQLPEGCSNAGRRTVVEITQVEVEDGGADGSAFTADNTIFMRQGVFIP